ncbi:MAG: SDR family NAD(P)-dependent oxidoreductase [Aequoribacter sp.]|uniref:SDR family NAD(P)-dependent oxidoreductase n=1 Tax=Aequoribacter sp. TaxID=2847771 RepID=UPI003C3997BE
MESTSDNQGKVVLVVGAGDAIGSAIATRFAQEGYTVCMARRNGDRLAPLVEELSQQGLTAYAFTCDARKEDELIGLFEHVESSIGALEVVVFNIGANVPMKIVDTDSRKFFKIWEMACFSGFLTGREAAKRMLARGQGTIIFTGATASLRGAAGFGAFASAKAGLRAMAQSLAKEMGPKNIHVAHVVIDAPVDTAWIMENVPEASELKANDGLVVPAHLAENYLMLHNQPRDAWTFELDIRPWSESW